MTPEAMMVETDARLPRYQRLRDDLGRRIAAGEWAPDQAIPSETELSQSYAVSIGTVRKAIDVLVSENLLQRNQGKGTFVRRPQLDSLLRFFGFTSRSGLPTAKVVGRDVVLPGEQVRAGLRLGAKDRAIHLSRLRLIDAQPVLAEEIWVPREGFEPLTRLALEEFAAPLYPLYERLCRQVVASATETLTVEQADKALAKVLGIAVASPVILVQRTAQDFTGKPLEWRTTRGAAARFQYRTEIR